MSTICGKFSQFSSLFFCVLSKFKLLDKCKRMLQFLSALSTLSKWQAVKVRHLVNWTNSRFRSLNQLSLVLATPRIQANLYQKEKFGH